MTIGFQRFAFVFLIAVSLASAFQLRSSVDYISVSSSTGSVYFYAENTGDAAETLSFSAASENLLTYFDESYFSIPANSIKGAYLRISSPDCFRGYETVTVSAQLCSSSSCETSTKKITVNAIPAKQCSSYVEGFATPSSFVPGYSCSSDGCLQLGNNARDVKSTVVFSSRFDPSGYEVRISGADQCTKITRGENAKIGLTLMNRGASGSFDLRLLGDNEELNSFLTRDYVSLSRSEATDISIYSEPSSEVTSGRHFTTLQALNNGQVISEKSVCIDIDDIFSTSLSVPFQIIAVPGKDSVAIIEIRNRGTSEESYLLEALPLGMSQDAVSLETRSFTLGAGESKQVSLQIDSSSLNSGDNRFEIIASGSVSKAVSQLNAILQTPEKTSVSANQSQADNSVTVTLAVGNDEDFAIDNITFDVSGIPSSWTVSKVAPFSVPAHSEKRFPVKITMNSNEEAQPIVTVKSNGRILSVQTLPKISGATGGFTGFFTATLAKNAQLALLVLVVFLLFFLFYIRGGKQKTEREEKLDAIRDEISTT